MVLNKALLGDTSMTDLVKKLMGIIFKATGMYLKVKHCRASLIIHLEPANKESTEDDAAVVQQAIALLIPSILSDKELLLSFYNYADLKTWLTCLVLKSPQPKIREEGTKGITAFSTQLLKEEYVALITI